MRERPDVVQESSAGEEVQRKRIDLSVPQVAGSAVAAVVAAKLASYFGVYGTILGAGVVSVIATCGGSLFQHFLKRTGEQLRGAAAPARPARQAPPAPGEFTEGTVYRARTGKSRKRPVVAAALVFGVTMAGITAYELVSGSSFSGAGKTTVGDAFAGPAKSSSDPGGSGESGDPSDSGASGESGESGGRDGSGGDSPSAPSSADPGEPGATPSGDASQGGGDSGTAGSPAPAPSASPSDRPDGGTAPEAEPSPSATTPAPGADSRSGTADPDQAGPAAR
ncbi:hypothetical protein ACWDV7_10030 [Streptomyces sp. NPDC003362]